MGRVLMKLILASKIVHKQALLLTCVYCGNRTIGWRYLWMEFGVVGVEGLNSLNIELV